MRAIRLPGSHPPTIFHVTHYKAGSQWVHEILRRCAHGRIVRPEPGMGQFLSAPIRVGKVYPTIYVTRQQFEEVRLPERWRRFVVIRDLRDTLLSAYFSVKISHPTFAVEPMRRLREQVQRVPFEEGLLEVMDRWVPGSARIQRSWAESGEPLIRYEDLLKRDVEILEQTLIDECQLPISRRKLRRAVVGARFERASGGRLPGQEDVTAHQRKGVAGDWRNYFTESVKDEFKRRWGDLLIETGYERGYGW